MKLLQLQLKKCLMLIEATVSKTAFVKRFKCPATSDQWKHEIFSPNIARNSRGFVIFHPRRTWEQSSSDRWMTNSFTEQNQLLDYLTSGEGDRSNVNSADKVAGEIQFFPMIYVFTKHSGSNLEPVNRRYPYSAWTSGIFLASPTLADLISRDNEAIQTASLEWKFT